MGKPSQSSHWPLRWDLLLRYRLIEIIALWEGRLTTNHLCDTFGIGRQQASADINNYLREIAPDNLSYDTTLKGYVPARNFKPIVTSGLADEYLHLLRRNNELSGTFEQLSLQVANTEMVQMPVRDIKPEIIRPLVFAARNRQRIEVDYVSLSNPDREGRIICPHTLVFTGMRWHARAFDEKSQEFRDFVLSRFRGKPSLEGHAPDQAHPDHDHAWQTAITLKIIPDRRLSKPKQDVIARDYGMVRGALKIPTRAALASYVLHTLRLDIHKIQAKPEAQQIELENVDDIKAWVFG
jgi:predicted DNA-binding transcriptional regulator YafY